MKKIYFFTTLLTVLLFSCNKKAGFPSPSDFVSKNEPRSIVSPESQNQAISDPVSYYSNQFLYDPSFALVMDKFMTNSADMYDLVEDEGGIYLLNQYESLMNSYTDYDQVESFYLTNQIDTAFMIQKHAEPIAAWLKLLKENPQFSDLSASEQLTVINNIENTLLNTSFISDNPGNILVTKFQQAYNRQLAKIGQNNGGFRKISTARVDLTLNEVIACGLEALGGAIANGYNTWRTLYGIITGYNLGWSGIVNVSKSALRTVLGSNVGGMVIIFAFCVASAAFF